MAGMVFPQAWAAENMSLIQNVNAYETMSLNGEWNYIVDVQEEGYYDYRMKPMQWGFFQNAKPQRPEDLIEYDFDKSPRRMNACSSTRVPSGLRRASRQCRCRSAARCSTSVL